MSGSVTDSDACGTDWENWIPQIDSTNENNFTWKPQWKNFRIKICSQDKVLENPSGYLDPIKIQFLMTHHFSKVQKIIRNLDISTIESINSTEELLEIKLKSVEDEDILTEIESALARKIGEIVMIPIQRLKFTSSLIEELFRQELKEKSIALMRDETNIFIVGFEKMKSYIFKNIDEIHRVTAKKVVKLEDKWKTEAVKYFGIAETIGRTFTDVVVRLQEDNSSVYLKGRDITISKAEKEVHKLLSELFTETLHFDPLILKLLMCKEASELLKQNLVKEQLKVVWTVDSTHLYFISKTKINTDALKAVVYKNFLAAGFSKSPHQESQFCDSEVFTKITKQHNDKLLFLETTGTSVNIAGTKSLIFRILHQEKLFYNDDIDTVDEIDQSIKMIKVSNISTGTSEDCIRYFFENKRKSGGGDIEDLDYDKDSHTAIITFEEDEVAERVISRMPLLFEKKNIDVEIFVPRPLTADVEDDEQALGNEETADMPTEFVIEVRGMKPTTSGDTIRYYFESRKVANADVIKMEFIEEKGMYIIWFEEESAIEAVISKNLRVEGQTLNAKRYVPLPPPKPVPKYDENVGLEANKGELLRPIPQTKICRTIAMCTIASGQTIKTVVGDITELDVDVIVNPANKELKHVGGLSKVIVDKGGKIIQKECDDYIRSKNRARKMYEGEVFCSTPGNLNCKMIAHAVGPVWQNGQSSEDEYLSECIEASLEKTEEMKYRSIAIPALCTGIFGYPANKATTVIVEAIYNYMRDNGTTTPIKQIYLCDVKEDTVSHFVSALDKFFGK